MAVTHNKHAVLNNTESFFHLRLNDLIKDPSEAGLFMTGPMTSPLGDSMS